MLLQVKYKTFQQTQYNSGHCSASMSIQSPTRSQAVTRIADRTASQHLWVTWRHRSRDHLIVHMSFPIGGPLERSLYLQPFSRYCVLSALG